MSFKNSRPSINRLPLTEMLKIIDSLEWSSPPPPNYKLPARDTHSGKLGGWSCCISRFQLCPATATSPSSWATAGHLPAFSDPGVGHLHILRSPGTRHFSTPARGYFRAFDTHAVSYQNITTQRILLEKSMFSILCMYFFIAYEARNT